MRTSTFGMIFGLLAIGLFTLLGCGGRATVAPPSGTASSGHTHSHDHGHGHGHEHGPHGGRIIDLGTEDCHAELKHAGEGSLVGVYLLGADAVSAVAVNSPSLTIHVSVDGKLVEYSLPAVPQPGEAAGKSSYFELSSEPLLAIVTGDASSPNTRARLSITIDGLPFAGEVETTPDEHSHGGAGNSIGPGVDDALIWRNEFNEGGYEISAGHHGQQLLAGANVEPAVQIMLKDQPVSNATVFNTLLADDGETVLAAEAATVYEPPTADEPSHYAQGALKIPPGTRNAIIRFRIALPENKGEHRFDVPVTVR